MVLFDKKLVTSVFVLIIFLEALSLAAYLYPIINPFVFGIVALTSLVLSLKNLEWGIWLVFAELAIGSFGKLFVLHSGGIELSFRIVLWLIVLSVWLSGAFRTRRITFFHSQFLKPYLALAAVLAWATAWGLWRGHDFGAVFFDVNNYLYFLLIFPVYEILSSGGNAPRRVLTIIGVAISWLAIKTITLFYIFSHELFGLQDILYTWSRKMQLAEITNINPAELTSRVFIQSQIWILFGLFVVLGYVFFVIRDSSTRRWYSSVGMTILFSAALIMSFSRSFWLAGILSLGFFLILLLAKREKFSRVFVFGILSTAIVVLAVGLTLGVAAFPISRGSSSADFIKNRASQFKEAAASSRLAQIRPLFAAISRHPAIGSGFGQEVTYQSQDPRVLKTHPDGTYTTAAFELGWLEIWLKLGLVGVGIYLYLLWRILKAGWQQTKESQRYLVLGSLAGLVAVILTHGVSPYLNHPLGIGLVLLLTSVFDTN